MLTRTLTGTIRCSANSWLPWKQPSSKLMSGSKWNSKSWLSRSVNRSTDLRQSYRAKRVILNLKAVRPMWRPDWATTHPTDRAFPRKRTKITQARHSWNSLVLMSQDTMPLSSKKVILISLVLILTRCRIFIPTAKRRKEVICKKCKSTFRMDWTLTPSMEKGGLCWCTPLSGVKHKLCNCL